MKKAIEWVSAAVRHNGGLFVAVIICATVVLWSYGCESRTISLVDTNRTVTRTELVLEVSAEQERLQREATELVAHATMGEEDLNRQDALKSAIWNIGLQAATGQAINPLAVITTIGTIIGVGAVVDNKRKDSVINRLSTPPA